MKRTLKMLSAVAAITLSTTSVVSCGISAESLMSRSIDPTVLNAAYYYPIDSWSTALMVGTWNYQILSDTQGTLVRTNRYNESVGELAISYSNGILHEGDEEKGYVKYGGPVGQRGGGGNGDYTWTYYLNPDAHWSTWDGIKQDQITGDDFVNTIFLAMCPDSNSQNISNLQAVIDNEDLEKILNAFESYKIDHKNASNHDDPNSPWSLIARDIATPGISDNGKYKTITFRFKQLYTFFDTVLSSDFWAPTPDKAVKYVYNSSIGGSGFIPDSDALQNYGLSYDTPLYSGAYLPESYLASGDVKLRANPNYVDKNNVNIKKINYSFVSQAYPNKERVMFESGDINDATLAISDRSGWDKYVGKDESNTNFPGVTSTYIADATTRLIIFNYANASVDGNGHYSKLRNSLAIQSQYVRAYIEYYLNRSTYTSYFSNKNIENDTSYIRNNLVPRNFAFASSTDATGITTTEDYEDVFIKEALSRMGEDASNNADMFEDGSDAFYKNDITLSFNNKFKNQTFSDSVKDGISEGKWLDTVSGPGQLVQMIKKEISQINKQMNDNSPISFDFIISDADANTVGKKTVEMIEKFNQHAKADGVGFVINPVIAKSADEYLEWRNKGYCDISSSGWQPDYADPSSYLATMTYKGGLDGRYGLTRLFDSKGEAFEKPKSPEELYDSRGKLLSPLGKQMAESAWNGDEKGENNLYTRIIWQLYVRFVNFAKKYRDAITESTTPNARYEKFAKAEFDLIYEDTLVFPLGIQNGDYQIKLTYIMPRTMATVAYGSSMYKHVGVKMSNHLLNRYERQIIENNYKEMLQHRRESGK